jgi:hypothetical protein
MEAHFFQTRPIETQSCDHHAKQLNYASSLGSSSLVTVRSCNASCTDDTSDDTQDNMDAFVDANSDAGPDED